MHKCRNMHPNVLLKQHYGKAALNHSGTTKGLFVLRSVFFYTRSIQTRTRQHSSHTNIYPSLSLLCPCCRPGTRRKEPLCPPPTPPKCVPVHTSALPCLVKSPPRPLLQERCSWTSSHEQQQLPLNLLLGRKKGQCCEAKRIMVDRVEGVLWMSARGEAGVEVVGLNFGNSCSVFQGWRCRVSRRWSQSSKARRPPPPPGIWTSTFYLLCREKAASWVHSRSRVFLFDALEVALAFKLLDEYGKFLHMTRLSKMLLSNIVCCLILLCVTLKKWWRLKNLSFLGCCWICVIN